VLVVAPAALLAEEVPQPHGQVLYDLLTGHPDRASRDLVFLADLTIELRAWPQQTWTTVGISPETALLAVVDGWRGGHLTADAPRIRSRVLCCGRSCRPALGERRIPQRTLWSGVAPSR